MVSGGQSKGVKEARAGEIIHTWVLKNGKRVMLGRVARDARSRHNFG